MSLSPFSAKIVSLLERSLAMAHVLYLNYTKAEQGLEEQVFGSFAKLTFYKGPGEPDDPPPEAECLRADGIISGAAQHDVGPIDRYPQCKIIVRLGVGYDNLDVKAWSERGVPVCNVPDYGTTEVADHALGLMLALVRGIVPYQDRLRPDPVGAWGWSPAPPLMRRLRGATFGVVGLGRIGLAAARRAAAFDMQVVFYDPYLPNGVDLATGYRRLSSLNALMAESDVVSLHAPYSQSTHHLINAEALAHAKLGQLLINTARGPLIDLEALEHALRSGRIGGAGLDVLPQEPPSPLPRLLRDWQAGAADLRDRLLITPHAAFFSPPGNLDIRRKAAEVVCHYLRDGHLTNCVNWDAIKDRIQR